MMSRLYWVTLLPDLTAADTLRGGPPEDHILHLSAPHLRFIAAGAEYCTQGPFCRRSVARCKYGVANRLQTRSGT